MRKTPPGTLEPVLRAVLDGSRDAIIFTGPGGEISEVNHSALGTFGCDNVDELLSLGTIEGLFEKKEAFTWFRRRLLRGSPIVDFEVRLINKEGQSFDGLVTSKAILGSDGEISGHAIVVRDISRQKRAQEQIEKQNVHLSTLHKISTALSSSLNFSEVLERTIDKILEILEAASVRIYVLEAEQQCLQLVAWKGLSDNFISMEHFRCRKVGDGLLGQTVLTLETKVVDNYLRADDPYVDSIIEEGLKSSVYIPLVAKERPVGAMCVSSYLEYRFSPEFVECLTAIGNQVGVAMENANLFETLKKAYQDLTSAQEQVIRTEKLASLGKLAATIAHEINNPIAVVLTYVKLMKKLVNRGTFNPERITDISRYLTTMESETARCGEIVKNLLAFARRSQVHVKDHDIEEVIERTLTLIAHELEIKGIQLVKEVAPDLPKVRCDFRQMQQALLNLMINATEAMTKGGVLTVRVSPAKEEGFIKVAICDTGCGISEKDLPSVFEPFYTTKEEVKGVGLGLSVVYGIITKHGGSIEVKSEFGKGSAFDLSLPVAQ